MIQSLVRALSVVFLTLLALFAGFGFLASYELPGSEGLPWRIGYALMGLLAIGGAFMALRAPGSTGKASPASEPPRLDRGGRPE